MVITSHACARVKVISRVLLSVICPLWTQKSPDTSFRLRLVELHPKCSKALKNLTILYFFLSDCQHTLQLMHFVSLPLGMPTDTTQDA